MVGVGFAEGFPPDPTKANRAEFFAGSGAAAVAGGTAWIGGALRDWFVFGFSFSGSYLGLGATRESISFTGGLHVAAFPAYSLGGAARDFGVSLDAGIGTAGLVDVPTAQSVADGGAVGKLQTTFFWEGLRGGSFAFGPAMGADYAFSTTLQRVVGFVGFRGAFYARP
jgi:hypothetical protein